MIANSSVTVSGKKLKQWSVTMTLHGSDSLTGGQILGAFQDAASKQLGVNIITGVLIQPVQDKPAQCTWNEDEDGIWHTGCGQSFFFDNGSPLDNKLRFCGFCGQPLMEGK